MPERKDGLKRRDVTPCIGCGVGVMHDHAASFYRVQIEQLVADFNAIRRQHGLELMLGNPMIAHVMGQDEDLAKTVVVHEGLLCFSCSALPVAALIERMAARAEKSEPEESAP